MGSNAEQYKESYAFGYAVLCFVFVHLKKTSILKHGVEIMAKSM